MILNDIIKKLEEIAPLFLAEEGDPTGFQVGDRNAQINTAIICMDVTNKVIDFAIDNKAELIISHHPFIHAPLTSLDKTSIEGGKIYKLIENNIALYSMHTNLDSAKGGINDSLAKVLDLSQISPIKTKNVNLYNFMTYVPEHSKEAVLKVLFESGAGDIGDYSSCSFSFNGIGTFMPKEGATPYCGKVGVFNKEVETKIEVVVPEERLGSLVSAALKAHPYEEPAYSVIKLENKQDFAGLGRVGKLKSPMASSDFIEYVKDKLQIDNVRCNNISKEISIVGLCGGSGMSIFDDAVNMGIDAYVNGDVKYHMFNYATDLDVLLIDAGHYETEVFGVLELENLINKKNLDIKLINYEKIKK